MHCHSCIFLSSSHLLHHPHQLIATPQLLFYPLELITPPPLSLAHHTSSSTLLSLSVITPPQLIVPPPPPSSDLPTIFYPMQVFIILLSTTAEACNTQCNCTTFQYNNLLQVCKFLSLLHTYPLDLCLLTVSSYLVSTRLQQVSRNPVSLFVNIHLGILYIFFPALLVIVFIYLLKNFEKYYLVIYYIIRKE